MSDLATTKERLAEALKLDRLRAENAALRARLRAIEGMREALLLDATRRARQAGMLGSTMHMSLISQLSLLSPNDPARGALANMPGGGLLAGLLG